MIPSFFKDWADGARKAEVHVGGFVRDPVQREWREAPSIFDGKQGLQKCLSSP
jgi:hypothetical protein